MGQNDGIALHKALGHPLRRRILRTMVDGEPSSPRQLSDAFDEPLSNLSYHFRVLADCGAVKLVGTKQVRGSLAHFYEIEVQAPWAIAALKAEDNISPDG